MPNTGKSGNWLSVITNNQLLFGILLCTFLAAELFAIPQEAPTVDEQNHLARGLSIWRTGDYRLLIGHPPLINLISALPLLFDTRIQLPLNDPVWRDADWIEFAISLLWKLDNPALAMIYAGRLMTVLLGALTLAALYRLGADVAGRWAGLLMAAFATFDPNFRAHARLITTDLGILLTLTLALIVWRRWLRRPRTALMLAAGFTLGLALGSKFSALLYMVVLSGLALLQWRFQPRAIARLVLVAVLALFVTWATYRFELRPLRGMTWPIPLANYWEDFGFAAIVIHTPDYLLGQVNPSFDWFYFPIVLAVKTPLPILLLAGLGLGVWLPHRGLREVHLWLPVGAYFGLALFSNVYIGYRHLFPLLPTLYLAAALGAIWLWQQPRAGRWLAAGSAAWLVVNTLLIYPRDLTFFNEIAGGPDRGWRITVDSNLDWGQDLGELVEFVREQQIDSIYVSYFGSIPIGSFFVDEFPLPAKPLPPRPVSGWHSLFPAPGWYAISISHLVGGAVLDDPDVFAYFRHRKPVAILGRTIYIYHMPEQFGAVAVCADPQPAISEAQAREIYGAALTRWIQFDCSRGLPLPPRRTWYVLRGEQVNTVRETLRRLGATLTYSEPHHTDGLSVYRLDAASALAAAFPVESVPPETFGGRMMLLGHRYREPLTAGQPMQVQTVWRIEAPLPESVSIFLHLTAPDGLPIEVSDGFNTPFDQLQPGDALIQFHPLPLPDPLPAGVEFRTGVYALNGTQPRYLLPDGRDFVAFSP
ncbi:MAG: glycosyltransferase family 39 protein [Anaerolineales bacterium]